MVSTRDASWAILRILNDLYPPFSRLWNNLPTEMRFSMQKQIAQYLNENTISHLCTCEHCTGMKDYFKEE